MNICVSRTLWMGLLVKKGKKLFKPYKEKSQQYTTFKKKTLKYWKISNIFSFLYIIYSFDALNFLDLKLKFLLIWKTTKENLYNWNWAFVFYWKNRISFFTRKIFNMAKTFSIIFLAVFSHYVVIRQDSLSQYRYLSWLVLLFFFIIWCKWPKDGRFLRLHSLLLVSIISFVSISLLLLVIKLVFKILPTSQFFLDMTEFCKKIRLYNW